MQVIEASPQMYGMLAFGMPHQSALNYVQEQLQNLPQTLTHVGAQFMERGREIFERYAGSEALRLMKSALRHVQHANMADMVQPLYDIGQIQQAPLAMQRWIMANPYVREQYHMQRCDGYSDTYVDLAPGLRGDDHYDYRKVMSGVVQELPPEEDADWKITHHFEFDHFDDLSLSLSEKDDILSVWDLIETMMGPGKEDPTSPFCSKQ